MKTVRNPSHPAQIFRLVAGIIAAAVLLLAASPVAHSQPPERDWWPVQQFEAADLGVSNPAGLAYAPASDRLLTTPAEANGSEFIILNLFGDRLGENGLTTAVSTPLNAAYYAPTDGLMFLDTTAVDELVQVQIGPRGDRPPASQSTTRYNARAYGIKNAQGITFDADHRRLYILDTGGPTPVLIRITADPGHSFDGDTAVAEGRLRRTRLTALDTPTLRGIAHNPANDHLYILGVDDATLFELTTDGTIVATYDLSGLQLADPQSMVFGASANLTDDPAVTHLYIADSGTAVTRQRTTDAAATTSDGQIVELALEETAVPAAAELASLVQIIDTSKASWDPSSPDPAGIAYRSTTGNLLISDSEIEENHPDFQGWNVFESDTSGTLVGLCSTSSNGSAPSENFSNEPTGAAFNPANGFIYFTDDNANAVFEVDLGPDAAYCTADDLITELDTTAFNSGDPEGLAYGANRLYISDGVNQEVYVVDLGADGEVGGTGADADSLVDQWDTAGTLGLRDPEGIEYNAFSGTLFLVSTIGSDDFLVETTTSGTAVTTYDLSFLDSIPRSGLAYGPGSVNPAVYTIYMASRGVDNGADPNENDGKVYELSIGPSGPTPTPSATPLPTATPTIGPSPTPTATPLPTATPTNTPPPPDGAIYLSFSKTASVGGITAPDEDILYFDTAVWTHIFDGSDVGLGSYDVNAFTVVDADTILLSLSNNGSVAGLAFNEYDILEFTAVTLGDTTAGTFSLYLDGEDVGLTGSAGDIDAIDLLPDGRVLISTVGSPTGTGVPDAKDEDVLAFTPTSLGPNTSGTWAMYFDGSDTDITNVSGPDVNAFAIAPDGQIVLSTDNTVVVGGINSEDDDIAYCTPISIGLDTVCNFAPTLFFDGSAWDLSANDIDGLSLPATIGPAPTPTSTPIPTATATPTNPPLPTNTPTAVPQPTATHTPIPVATATATPTNPPLPTNTPTAVPQPTATHTPIPVATATATATPPPQPTSTSTPLPQPSPTATSTPPPTNTPTPPPQPTATPTMTPVNALYLSLASGGTVGGTSFGDEDILWFDGTGWNLLFDGSDVGAAGDLNAFHIIDANTILMSFSKDNTINGVAFDDQDVVMFTAVTLGTSTTGTFSLFFDGDTAELTSPSEDIDAVHLLDDGRLVVSTLGTPAMTGVTSPKDEDLFAFTPTTPGDYTGGGTWQTYFDASDVGISGGLDMDAVAVAASGDIYLSTDNTTTVGGLSADDEDVFICTPTALGTTTSCTFAPTLYFDGSLSALEGNDLDALHLP